MKITFDDVDPLEARRMMEGYFGKMKPRPVVSTSIIPEDPEPEPELKPARRRRRTKAEMEEAKAKEEAEAKEAILDQYNQVEKPVRRRRRRAASEVEDKPEPRRRRRRAAPEADDEITDRDVAKAASDAAQDITPAAVKEVLDQFGVGNVADLDQEQRREFIALIDQAINQAIDDEIPF